MKPKKPADEKPKESLDEKPKESLDEKPKEPEDEKPKESEDEKPKTSEDEKPKESAGEKPKDSVDEKPKESLDEKPKESEDEKPKESVDEKPKESAGEKPKESVDEKPKEVSPVKQLAPIWVEESQNRNFLQLGFKNDIWWPCSLLFGGTHLYGAWFCNRTRPPRPQHLYPDNQLGLLSSPYGLAGFGMLSTPDATVAWLKYCICSRFNGSTCPPC